MGYLRDEPWLHEEEILSIPTSETKGKHWMKIIAVFDELKLEAKVPCVILDLNGGTNLYQGWTWTRDLLFVISKKKS